jgi:integration host factor subunit beta
MNRSDLINVFKEETTLSKKDAEKVVDTFFGSITEALASNERVEIRGFGSFTVKQYKPYTGRNPKTGVQIKVSSKKLPFFKVGKELKNMVDDKT